MLTIPKPTAYGIRCQLIVSLLLLAFETAELSSCIAAGTQLTPEIIRNAWASHSTDFPTFEYKCHLIDRSATFDKAPSGDAFSSPGSGNPKGYVTAQKNLFMKRDGEKMALQLEGDQWDSVGSVMIEQQRTQSTYDGDSYRTLNTAFGMPRGLGAFGGEHTVIEQLVTPMHFAAILCWRNLGEVLSAYGMDLGTLRVTKESVEVNKTSCVELSLSDAKKIATALVYVEKKEPFLPIQITFFSHKGAPLITYNFTYKPDSKDHFVLDTWSELRFNADQVLERQVQGEVRECLLGTPIPDTDFVLKFPVGTHIIEYTTDGEKYWVQSSDDEMTEIKKEEFGSRPKTEVSEFQSPNTYRLALTSLAVFGLSIALMFKYWSVEKT